jgi:peptidoglycan hydrolase CwlO-like protein
MHVSSRFLSLRRAAGVLATAAAFVLVPVAARADLPGQLDANKASDRALQGAMGADSRQIDRTESHLADLRRQLAGLQQGVDAETGELRSLRKRLRGEKAQLAVLRLRGRRDDRILARQLVGQYEAPRVDVVTVLLQSHGFAQLLERANGMKAVAEQNATVTQRVRAARAAVATQTRRLADLEVRQARVAQSAILQRDRVDQIRIELVNREHTYRSARATKAAKLQALRADRKKLRSRLVALQATAAASVPGSGASDSGPGLPAGGAPAYVPHGGSYGLFLARGTNYGVGDTPRIAARLDVMGQALHLHLIGLSGYRTPQHSVEVGGFANDPHTRGQASDTPGLEGVPEGTLNRYGLTRPFGGTAELDHVQLVGSI